MSSENNIVWIDCEMTGLDLQRDALIEVAVIVTDGELNALDEGFQVVIKPPQKALDGMGDYVRKMHTASGLLDELPAGLELSAATSQVYDYIRAQVPHTKKAPLAGNSVGMDKLFLAEYMPQVINHLHYRIIDVSTLKELARRWYPEALNNAPEKHGNHRALGDIRDSINELSYYREVLFRPHVAVNVTPEANSR